MAGTASLSEATTTLYSEDFENMTTDTMTGLVVATAGGNYQTTNTIETDSTNYLKAYGPSDRDRRVNFIFGAVTTSAMTDNKATISFRTKLVSGNYAGTSAGRTGSSLIYVLPDGAADAPKNGAAPADYLFALKVQSTSDASNKSSIVSKKVILISGSEDIVLSEDGTSSYGVTVTSSQAATTNWISVSADVDFDGGTADIKINNYSVGTVDLASSKTGLKGFGILTGQKSYGTVNLDDILITTEDDTNYTITTDNNTIGGSVAIADNLTEAVSGTTITVTPTADTNYTVSSVTYTDANGTAQAATDNGNGTYSFTMPAANTTVSAVFTLSAQQYTHTINSNAGGFTSSGSGYEGDTVRIYYPEWIWDSTSRILYSTSRQNSGPYYAKEVTISDHNTEETLTYNPYAANVVYASEGESITGLTGTSANNADIRCSMGRGGYGSSASLTTLAPGRYKVFGQVWGGANMTANVYKGSAAEENLVWTQATTGSLSSSTGSEFTLTESTEMVLSMTGSGSSKVLDYIYIQQIPTYTITTNVTGIGTASASAASLAQGETFTVTATPGEGAVLSSLTVTDGSGNVLTDDNGVYTMPASNVTVTAVFTVPETVGEVTVQYKDGSGNVLGSNTPSVEGMAIGDTLTYYYPAYVEYNGAFYKANTADSRVFGGTAELSSTAQTIAVEYTLDPTVVAFAEGENTLGGGGNYAGNVGDRWAQNIAYSSGKTRAMNTSKYQFYVYADIVIPEDGTYEFSGPLYNVDGSNRTGVFYIDSYAYENGAPAGKLMQSVTAPRNTGTTPSNFSFMKTLTAGTHRFIYGLTYNLSPGLDYLVVKPVTTTYTVSAAAVENGTVEADTASAGEGQKVFLSAVPASGYKLASFTVTGQDGTVIANDGTSFTMPAQNVTVSAEFTALGVNTITTETAGTGSGTVTVSPEKDSYTEGETVTVNVSTNTGTKLATLVYSYTDGAGDLHTETLIPVNGAASFVMPNASVTITATFGENIITLAETSNGTAAVDPECYALSNGSMAANSGTLITGTYTPSRYYTLDDIVVSVVDGATGETVECTKENGTFSFTMPEHSVIITVTFKDTRLALVPMPIGTTATVTGYSSNENITTSTIVDQTNQYIGVYSNETISIGNSGTSMSYGKPTRLNNLDGLIEVIPAVSGVISFTYAPSTAAFEEGTVVRLSQTADYSSESIGRNNIAAAKHSASDAAVSYELKAVVEAGVPVYFYTDTRYVKVTSVSLTHSNDYAGEEWRLDDESTPLVGAWDITVVSQSGNEVTGRVWTDIFYLNTKAHKRSLYAKTNILTEDAYEYKFDFNGLQPYSFLFYSNNRGFLMDKVGVDGTRNVQSLMHSFYSFAQDSVGTMPTKLEKSGFTTKTYGNYTPKYDVDRTNKLFINDVDSDAMLAYTGKAQRADESSSGLMQYILPKYVGYGGNADNTIYGDSVRDIKGEDSGVYGHVNKGTIGLGGKFTFTLKRGDSNPTAASNVLTLNENGFRELQGQVFRLEINFSGYDLDAVNHAPVTTPTSYTDPITRTVSQVEDWNKLAVAPDEYEENNVVVVSTTINGPGTYNIIWDGKDAYGNEVPVTVHDQVDFYPVQIFQEAGVVHMPMVDVERFPFGVQIQRLRPGFASTLEAGDAALMDVSDDDYNLYYNNYAVPPTATGENPAAYDRDVSDTTWYYVGKTKYAYPSKIGDGKNLSAGVSTKDQGAMIVTDYTGDDKNIKLEHNNNVINANSDGAYGDRAGLDMWSSSKVTALLMYVGVNPSTNTTWSPAIVSFVAEDGRSGVTEENNPLTISHVAEADGNRVEYPNHVGRPTYREVTEDDAPYYSFGNTISTAFLSEFEAGPTERRTDTSGDTPTYVQYPIEGVLWTVTVPADDADKSDDTVFIKVDKNVNTSYGGDGTMTWSGLASGSPVMSDSTELAIGSANDKHELDLSDQTPAGNINFGQIYKTNGTGFKLQFKHRTPTISVATGSTFKVVVGIVLDNIYAPKAEAIATYVDDKEETDSNEGTTVAGLYTRSDGYDELSFSSETDENRVAAFRNTVTEGKEGFYNNSRNIYSGKGRVSLGQMEAMLFGRDHAVSLWDDYDENGESVGDIMNEQSETSGSGDRIDMEDLSDGIETIDDILGYDLD